MQLEKFGNNGHSEDGFQYPRSDRRRCNAERDAVNCATVPLSVSSVGSEAMQLAGYFLRRLRGRRFQYPRSDRRRCNDRGSADGLVEFSSFQYPRSDRRRCNGVGWASLASWAMAFSILGRIGGDATRWREDGPGDYFVFQYPRSDRRRCNPQWPPAGLRILGLSVSSVGSEAMQQ